MCLDRAGMIVARSDDSRLADAAGSLGSELLLLLPSFSLLELLLLTAAPLEERIIRGAGETHPACVYVSLFLTVVLSVCVNTGGGHD